MWSAGSHRLGREQDSPPFKDFNIFDTLEPKKVETFGTNNVKTGFLVDISDSDNQPESKILGSLLDAKKTEYSLVDLLENLYVTPQHVASKNSDLELLFDDAENNIEIPANSFDNVNGKIETKNVNNFDIVNGKIETKNVNSIDNVNGKIETKNLPKVDLVMNKVRSFDEIFDSAVSARYPKIQFSEPETKYEDNSNGVLKGLTLERSDQTRNLDVSEIGIGNYLYTRPNEKANNEFDNVAIDPITPVTVESPILNSNTDLYKSIKVLKPPKVLNTERQTSNNVPVYDTSNPKQNRHTSFTYSHIFNNISHIHLQNLYQSKCKKPETVNLFQSDTFTRYRKTIDTSLIDPNKPPIALIKNTEPIPVLRTAKKDIKLFNKRRLIKKDIDKIGFTKGPDIYEKSVVLPQIVRRLGEREKALNAERNLKKKLVLDRSEVNLVAGNLGAIKKKIDVPKLSPEVLMEDCNKERLKALKLRTDFERFVVSGQI